jgi:hypothetical protein
LIFYDFTAPPSKALINASKLQKICRAKPLGYVIQVNCITEAEQQNSVQYVPSTISEVL